MREQKKSIGYIKNNVKKKLISHNTELKYAESGKHYKISIMRNTQPPKNARCFRKFQKAPACQRMCRQLWKQRHIRKRNFLCLDNMEVAFAIKKSNVIQHLHVLWILIQRWSCLATVSNVTVCFLKPKQCI